MTKLKVTVGEESDPDETTRQRLKAAQAGEELEDAQPVLNFDSFAELSRLLSPKNLELLEASLRRSRTASATPQSRLTATTSRFTGT